MITGACATESSLAGACRIDFRRMALAPSVNYWGGRLLRKRHVDACGNIRCRSRGIYLISSAGLIAEATRSFDIDTTIVYDNAVEFARRLSADDAILNVAKYALDVAL